VELNALHHYEIEKLKASFEIKEKLYEAAFEAIEKTSAGEQQLWDEIRGKSFLIRNGTDYPPEINSADLGADWSAIWDRDKRIFRTIQKLEDFDMAVLPKDGRFERLRQRACALKRTLRA
jgi:hypothetical protein